MLVLVLVLGCWVVGLVGRRGAVGLCGAEPELVGLLRLLACVCSWSYVEGAGRTSRGVRNGRESMVACQLRLKRVVWGFLTCSGAGGRW